MRLTKFAPVYPKKGKTNFAKFMNKAGAYIIKHKGKIVYVGMSKSNVYKTMIRHFQEWEDDQKRVTYPQSPDYRARVIVCTPNQASKLETFLILRHKPRDNDMKIEFAEGERSEKEYKQLREQVKKALEKGEIPF